MRVWEHSGSWHISKLESSRWAPHVELYGPLPPSLRSTRVPDVRNNNRKGDGGVVWGGRVYRRGWGSLGGSSRSPKLCWFIRRNAPRSRNATSVLKIFSDRDFPKAEAIEGCTFWNGCKYFFLLSLRNAVTPRDFEQWNVWSFCNGWNFIWIFRVHAWNGCYVCVYFVYAMRLLIHYVCINVS